jgi:ribosomal protein S18 acetylase RimI-like enzyme
MIIRRYRSGDLRDLYRVCLRTGNSGGDATALYQDPDLLGHIYAAPYGMFEPALAFVVEDEFGMGGYCLGALDTRAFEQRLEERWWPSLRRRYAEPDIAGQGQWTPDEQAIYLIHHPWHVDDDLLADYPSHLHIDLLPRLQAQGLGRQLIGIQLTALRERGSGGVHLYVTAANHRALGFYARLGFDQLRADGGYLMGMKLLTPGQRVAGDGRRGRDVERVHSPAHRYPHAQVGLVAPPARQAVPLGSQQ